MSSTVFGHSLSAGRWFASSAANPRPRDSGRATDSSTLALSTSVTTSEDHANPRVAPIPPVRTSNHILTYLESEGPGAQGADPPNPDTLPDEPATRRSLRCVSCNVQKSRSNTTILLERHRNADIVCVQEIFWGFIKLVPSPESPDGIEYFNTVSHPNFICIGASATSRVATYIHRRWAKASPQLIRGTLAHDDINCVSLQFDAGKFTFLNVYNDSRKHDAVPFLLDRFAHLPAVAFMAGDFNLRHQMWDNRENS